MLNILKKNNQPATAHPNETATTSALGHEHPSDRLHQQLLRFFFFGAFNTAIDFAVLNLGLYVFHLPEVAANVISISVALVAGYVINQKFVFRRQPPTKRHVGYFLIITLTGLYGLQSGLIELLAHYPLAQSTLAGFLSTIVTHVPFSVLESNAAKLIATIASGLWNFILFRKFVFIKHNPAS